MMMATRATLWLVVLGLVCLAAVPGWGESLSGAKVRFVDSSSPSSGANNFLFRGNEPLSTNNTFAYADLVMYMGERAKEANLTLPADFDFVDICLLSSLIPKEHANMKVEEAWVSGHASFASFINWALVGDLTDPQDLSEDIRKALAKELDHTHDHLPTRVSDLKTWLDTPAKNPTVYYVHCEGGMDRTGMLMGSYYMNYLGWSYNETVWYNYAVSDRPQSYTTRQGLNYYCWWLYYWNSGFTDLDCSVPEY